MKINKEISILDLLQKYPEANEILVAHDLGCAKCLGAIAETLESVANSNDIDLELLLEELEQLDKD